MKGYGCSIGNGSYDRYLSLVSFCVDVMNYYLLIVNYNDDEFYEEVIIRVEGKVRHVQPCE